MKLMKNYILTLLFAFVALTSCNNDEYYYKTPGEITGEKIIEMVKANNYITLCVIPGIYSEPRSFHVDGQFLHLDAGNGWREVTYDLNHLLNWEYIPQNNNRGYFRFKFNLE